jgi:peptidoglycan/LPS O-acetylase OafA/YrhL
VAAAAGTRRLPGLDGLRGMAALFVVMHHVFLRAFPGYPADRAPVWASPFIFGRFAVVVFIVLSGFSLALSPARRGWQLGGLSRFFRRRARRILPAYWAALALSLAVAWLVMPPPGQPSPGPESVLADALLLQNLVILPTPNGAFWSLAVESQLYLLFPLMLLAVRRRGPVALVASATLAVAAIGVAAPYLTWLEVFVVESAPDLAALFAFGVLAAGIVSASEARRSWPWPALAAMALVPVLATIAWRGQTWTLGHLLWADLMLGPAVACLLAALATGRPSRLVRLLETGPVRALGRCSYSLYLTHGPIVVLVYELIVLPWIGHGPAAFAVSLALVLPLTIAFARVFAAAFERSVRAEPRRQRVAEQHDVAHLTHLGERRPLPGVPRETAVANEPRAV